jgi:hypothetical protein
LQKLAALQQQTVVGRHRFDDDGGDAVALARKEIRERLVVVERQHARQRGEIARHAGRRGLAEGHEP